jgi:hypothetical protein
VKKRFPTLQHLVESGILNENEKEIIRKIDELYIQVAPLISSEKKGGQRLTYRTA